MSFMYRHTILPLMTSNDDEDDDNEEIESHEDEEIELYGKFVTEMDTEEDDERWLETDSDEELLKKIGEILHDDAHENLRKRLLMRQHINRRLVSKLYKSIFTYIS